MKDDNRTLNGPEGIAGSATDRLMALCHNRLGPLLARRAEVLEAMDDLETMGDEATVRAASRLRRQAEAMEPSVTFIGQVKAGKTSLLNAMVGEPGLLPADVNPWTSVVTSLHLCPKIPADGHRAQFSFFDQEDWDRLTRSGGRVGELAGRAGAEDEAEKVRGQVAAMREKTMRRLGRKFELLLGQKHSYGSFDQDLIERYVCLGDDFDDGGAQASQGRYADITRSADLWLHRPGFPVSLCMRDTPGVNDTFMMREQITIRAIRDSRLCVVVLSAHQALSSVDMALIRLISNVRSREVLIFVNRIDELADPSVQIGEIRESIRATLKAHHGPADAEIVFGSAYWANAALRGNLGDMAEDSAAALVALAEATLPETEAAGPADELIWEMSGVPTLYRALWQRIAEGAAQETLQSVARGAMNLATGIRASQLNRLKRAAGEGGLALDATAIKAELDRIEAASLRGFEERFAEVSKEFARRLDRSHKSFLDRATAALIKHLETYGELAPWSYDPTGLRLLMRSGYQVFARAAVVACSEAFEDAGSQIAALYGRALGQPADDFQVAAPPVPRLQPPVLVGQTIALDLQGTWWRRWWQRRRGYRAFAKEFADMIAAETQPIVGGLKATHCTGAHDDMVAALRTFFNDQRTILAEVARPDARAGRPTAAGGAQVSGLDRTLTTLANLAA